MQKFVNFVFYNVIVYLVYMVIDKIFTFFNFYSSEQLGKDLSVMPTQTDMVFILINVLLSSIIGYFLLKKINKF